MYVSTKFSLLISFALPSEEEETGALQSVLLWMGVAEQPAAKCPSTFGVFQVNSSVQQTYAENKKNLVKQCYKQFHSVLYTW